MPLSPPNTPVARATRDANLDALNSSTAFELQTMSQLAALLPALRVATGMVIAALVLAALYFGRDLLIPLALATLFGFLLSPLVRRLKRWGLPQAAAAVVVVVLTLGLLGAGGAYLASQASSLSAQLPTYQKTIRDKLANLRQMASGPSMWDGVISTFKTFEREVSRMPTGTGAATPNAPAGTSGAIAKVEVVEPQPKPVQVVMGWLGRLSEPAANAGIVLLFVILFLLDKGDLRDRLLRLMGGNLHLATDAMDEASERIGSYLRMQLLVNVSYGIPMAVGLWMIGVPGAFLWGVTAAVMRFIPYVGAMLSAIFPLVLAFAVAPGWEMVLWTAGLILVLELVSNNLIEPWLYGESTGLSTLSIIVSATFWTALWGPIGLILATPLTVCLLVLGRHLPSLKFLDMLLGSEPVLDPPHRLYQRLLAGDTDDALELAQSQIETLAGAKPDAADTANAVTAFYDTTGVPMLRIGTENHLEASTSEHRLRLASSIKLWLQELQDDFPSASHLRDSPSASNGRALAAPIHCVGTRWEVDATSASMVAHALRLRGLPASHALWPMGAQREDGMDWRDVQVVCLCTFHSQPQAQVRQLIRRLRRQHPGLQVVVAAWSAGHELLSDEAAAQLGAVDVVNRVESVVLRAQTTLQADAEMGWLAPTPPEEDTERVQALQASGLLDPALKEVFRDAARQAVNAFDVPFAQIALVDRSWVHTPGSLLTNQAGEPLQDGVPRDQALAAWVVSEEKPFIVNDVSRDPRFNQNPALRGHGVRFYAGVPLRLKADGPIVGSFEVLDREPNEFGPDEIELLTEMAQSLVAQAMEAATQKSASHPAATPTD